jgi:hypothetical protein
MEPVLGGLHICRPAPLSVSAGDVVGLTLLSDLHLGAAHVDYNLIARELKTARDNNDRILVNGDIFDLILTKDLKRFTPDALHPRLLGRKDIVNEAVGWAVELFAPLATQIDMLGMGNHEDTVLKYANVDPLKTLVEELQKKVPARLGHVIHYGGYSGFVDYRLKRGKQAERFVVYYHHGSGSAAPVTKGMIDFNRKDTWVSADLIWMGHKHNRWAGAVQRVSCPEAGDEPCVRDVRHVMTGAYFQTYRGQSQESVRQHGRRSNYAADMGLAPQGMGGARVLLEVGGGALTVRVVQ